MNSTVSKPVSPPVVRCFWAVRPPDENLQEVGKLVRAIRRPLSDLGLQVSYVRGDSYHLTLKFLGDVAESQLGELINHIESQLQRTKLPRLAPLRLAGLGVFPGPKKPQVVFVDVQSVHPGSDAENTVPPALGHLHTLLSGWHERFGLAADVHPFHPHLTLGRVRQPSPPSDALPELLGRYADFPLGAPFAVETLILYESKLTPTGPKYSPLARVPLASFS